jgi:hypothetical protein
MKEIDFINKPRHKELIDVVLKQIVDDVLFGDLTSVEEMLTFLPIINLVSYLPDETINKFKDLMEDK